METVRSLRVNTIKGNNGTRGRQLKQSCIVSFKPPREDYELMKYGSVLEGKSVNLWVYEVVMRYIRLTGIIDVEVNNKVLTMLNLPCDNEDINKQDV